MKRILLSTLTLSLAAAFANAADKPAGAPAAATAANAKAVAAPISGVDTQYIDTSVRPQDDFFTYLNGKWLKETEIPSDKASWGTFMKLRDDTNPQIRAIIEAAQADKSAKAGSETQKIGDLYTSYMDEARRESLGVKPLGSELQKIRTLKDKKGLPNLVAHLSKIGVSTPYGIYVSQDMRNSTEHVVYISQSGLGMPDRDYYLKQDDAKLAEVRTKYLAHVEKTLALAGEKDAAAQAKAIVDFETELAKVQWTRVENRDPVKRYNKMTFAQLKDLMPGFDWTTWMKDVGVAGKVDSIIVSQPSYLAALDKIIAATPVDTWKSYYAFHLISAYAPYLSQPFVDESFAFRGTVLSGTKENRPLDKRAIALVNRELSEVVGKAYVERHFPAERKAQVEEMVKNFILAFKEGIETLDWMSPETKKQAQIKLSKMNAKIGYPAVRFGTPDMQFHAWFMGMRAAMEMMITGD